jgi:hypothetical protein
MSGVLSELERAVVEAAITWHTPDYDNDGGYKKVERLSVAVDALITARAAQGRTA